MKIVIDIDEEDYKRIQDIPDVFNSLTSRTYSAIRNGKPLPEHHGRLIDADSLIKTIEETANLLSNTDTVNGLRGAVALIFGEPTIIKRGDSK